MRKQHEKTKKAIGFQELFRITNQITGKMKDKKPGYGKFCNYCSQQLFIEQVALSLLTCLSLF